MVVVSYSGREINAKIVYYGPGLSGKTTNLEKIYDSVPETNRGRMVSMKTQTDRTLFFDLLPLDLGDLQGMKTRLLLYTVPGQVYYNATRKLVLKGVDAVVFVADSAADKMAENRESFANLEMNLKAYGIDIRTIPLVMQYNKRDLPTAVPIAEMNKELNRLNVPWFEAQAANGTGVFETLRGVSKLLLAKISKDVLEKDKGAVAGIAKAKASAERAKIQDAESRKSVAPTGGKLLKFLKKGKGGHAEESEAVETPASESVSASPSAASQMYEPAPLLGDEALVEDAPAAGFPQPLNAEEELVLTEDDLVAHPPPGAPPIPTSTPAAPSGINVAPTEEEGFGDFEREQSSMSAGASYKASRVSTDVGDARRVTVPIDLGALPSSGRVTLAVEITIRVESDEPPKKKSLSGSSKQTGLDDTFTRDLEPTL